MVRMGWKPRPGSSCLLEPGFLPVLQLLHHSFPHAHYPIGGLRKPGGAGWDGLSVVCPHRGVSRACYSGTTYGWKRPELGWSEIDRHRNMRGERERETE